MVLHIPVLISAYGPTGRRGATPQPSPSKTSLGTQVRPNSNTLFKFRPQFPALFKFQPQIPTHTSNSSTLFRIPARFFNPSPKPPNSSLETCQSETGKREGKKRERRGGGFRGCTRLRVCPDPRQRCTDACLHAIRGLCTLPVHFQLGFFLHAIRYPLHVIGVGLTR